VYKTANVSDNLPRFFRSKAERELQEIWMAKAEESAFPHTH